MRRAPIDPSLLPTFLAVVEARTISAAARLVHLSQPAVTAQMRKLEESVGAALLVRSVRGVTPTDAGLRLARYARRVRALLAEAADAVGGEEASREPLVVAASTTIAAHVLPPLLARFRAAHPEVALTVHVGNTRRVVEDVRDGRVPLGLVEGHARAAGVRLEPFADDEIVPIVGALAAFEPRRTKDLERVPILWREEGSGTRAVVERELSRAGIDRRGHLARDLVLGSTEAILGGVAAGLGVGFVSRFSARAHLAAGLVRLVPGLELVIRRTFRWALPPVLARGATTRFYELAVRAPLG